MKVVAKLARNYGIEKTSWLDIGGKSILVLLVLSWLIVGVVYVGMKLPANDDCTVTSHLP
jgi:hypothetical protein